MTDLEIANHYISKASNASKRGIEFTISFVEFKRMYTKTKCYYTGIPICQAVGTVQNQDTKTIDRIDNNKGYVPGNCVVCSRFFNQLKSTYEGSNLVGFSEVYKGIMKLNRVINK